MTFVLRLISRTVGLALLTAAMGLTTILAIALIMIQLFGEEAFMDRLACNLGLSDDCIRQQLEETREHLEHKKRELDRERQELSRTRRDLAGTRSRMSELEGMFERLSKVGHAASSYVVFYDTEMGPFGVQSGHRYASLLDPDTLIGGWCSIQFLSADSVHSFVHIQQFDRNLRLYEVTVSPASRRAAGLTLQDIKAARTRCKWPAGVS